MRSSLVLGYNKRYFFVLGLTFLFRFVLILYIMPKKHRYYKAFSLHKILSINHFITNGHKLLFC